MESNLKLSIHSLYVQGKEAVKKSIKYVDTYLLIDGVTLIAGISEKKIFKS